MIQHTQAGSTPAFGAPSSTPAFGAPAASSGGFSFGGGAAPAFGAPAASSGGFSFGGASTPAFGAPAASSAGGSLFGGSAPAFGASGGFGAPAATSSPFGGSLFGTPTTALTQAGPSLGIFGQPPTQTGAAASIFGAAAAAAPQQQPAAAQFAPVALSSGAAGAAGAAGGADAARELQEIANCYSPGHSSFKFSHLFLNVVRPEQRVRPQGVDELSWKQAIKEAGGEDNPEGLWPTLASGFGDLLKRAQVQAATMDENKQRLSELRDLAHKLARRQETDIGGRVRSLMVTAEAVCVRPAPRKRERHTALTQRLLSIARSVDGLEGRLAMYMGVRGDVSREREAAIARTMDGVEGELSLAAAGGLQRRADVVAAAVRLRASGGAVNGGGGGGGGDGGGSQALDEASMGQLFAVLKDHADALQRLQEVLRRDVLDASVLRGGSRDQTAPAGLGMAVLESA
ncbi:hypothetical protein MNEG_2973 [Monoraphidium neglectum]|uniref:Nucleoporin Nup54 alpha-helical domain-containing protein n=1 Tax=Monoraphidium neglectum TaxID=145388 RepID=A0A0D2NJB7_9CHLO|nr:hypothetical protein MNEG_2973 [Monoraphidium neglectum]KIZ04986.1 hypothetical protein MNEG_2973 [Monoraphidium neglectum]|eukprot:XP_013904005.1 hypothetical protein MNEG_2973 [Monoraphidium neglectum]